VKTKDDALGAAQLRARGHVTVGVIHIAVTACTRHRMGLRAVAAKNVTGIF
jgi:hypothetical protein